MNLKLETMKEIMKALAAFQQEVPIIHKGTKGYGYSYADLPAIFEVINPLLKKHGLGFTQKVEIDHLATILVHLESGEFLQSCTKLTENVKLAKMNEFQVLGSQITYLRRYALSSMLGLVTDVDNDAAGEQLKEKITEQHPKFKGALQAITNGNISKEKAIEALKTKFNLTPELETKINKFKINDPNFDAVDGDQY